MGEIILPSKIPNLDQALFKGVRKLGFKKAKIKKIKLTISDQFLISL